MRIAPAKRKDSSAVKAARGAGTDLGSAPGSATALVANLGHVSWWQCVSVSQLGMLLFCSAGPGWTGTSARRCNNLKTKECMHWGGGRQDTALLTRLRFKRWVGTAALLLQPG